MHIDLHLHSNVSVDSQTTMEAAVKSAITKGVNILCFTDHCDLICAEQPGFKRDSSFEHWAVGYEQIAAVREKYGDKIEILHGMELGEIPQDPVRARQYSGAKGLDFLIGSIHALPSRQDFYYLQYGDDASCYALTEAYLDENILLAKENIADVIGHIGYTNRYMVRQGKYVDFLQFEEKLRELFSILVQNGRGIEINCSGLRQVNLNESFPNLEMLKLYKEMGGEILTIGSDAHTEAHVGAGFYEARELAKQAGFAYMTVFRKRKAEFIAI